MLSAEEVAELRALHERAYGREGGLTATEAARLRELDERRLTTASGSRVVEARDSWVAEPVEAPALGPSTGSGTQESASAESPATDDVIEPAVGGTLRSLLRARWRPVALAVVALLAIGVGAGWALFGRSSDAVVALTSEQQEWQNDLLVAGRYDAGSVRAVAVEEGVVVWTATKDDRAQTCLILSDGKTTAPTCQKAETVADMGLQGSMVVTEDGDTEQPVGEVNAQLLLSASGEPAVVVNTFDYSDMGMITYASEEETRIAERLVEEGMDPGSIWVVGYDRGVPIWSTMTVDSGRQCLVYDGSTDPIEMTCDDTQLLQEQGASLVVEHVGEDGEKTTFELSPNVGPTYLVITRQGGVSGAGGE
ncbi:hypothetical protein [Microbacterium sp. PMB16]|uniref:hypothetical protein n=1 Tax=Microbacterium sp. PMB16 TaxID=3120157 RepID=UPI003F4BF6CF